MSPKQAETSMFVIGTQYLRGLTPACADWDRDMARMRDIGFNTIRAWLVWGVLEPREGKVALDSLDTFLDVAGKHDLQVGLLFHLHGAPEWAISQYPEYWYVDKRGRPFEPAARNNTPSGGWPGLCPDHPAVADLEEEFIAAVADHVGARPELAFWEPMNEPHNWVDIEETPPGVFCYCPATRAAFREWLKRKYGTLQTLCEAWGRMMGNWNEVRPPTWKYGFTDWADWRTFAAESIAAHISRRADVIRRHSNRPVIAHAWGGASASCLHLGAMAFDDWKNAAGMDKWGDSAFPNTPETTVMVGFGTDLTRCAARGKEFWQAELGTGENGWGLDRDATGPARPEWLAMWTWESVRHGAKGILYWSDRKETHGTEIGTAGFVDAAGRPLATAPAAAEIAGVLSRNAELFKTVEPPCAQVAVLFSYQSYMVDWAQHRDNSRSLDAVSGYYRIFWDANIPVDFVHEEFATEEQLVQYRLVILPFPVALHGNIRPLLKRYVENGGTLLSDPFLCVMTPAKQMDREIPGGGFDRLFGCRQTDIRNARERVLEIHRGDRTFCLAQSEYKESYCLYDNAEPFACYADGTPAIVENRFGQGRAILSGVNLGTVSSPRLTVGDDFTRKKMGGKDADGADALVLEIAAKAGVVRPIETPPDVRGNLMHGRDGKHVLIAFNTKANPVKGTVHFLELLPQRAWDLVHAGNNLSRVKDGIHLNFGPYGTRVIMVEGAPKPS